MAVFTGVKILDLTRVLSGPLATRHFAQQGAEVVKLENLAGDDTRAFPPQIGQWSGYFELLNHNKKSVVIDLKTKAGLEYFYDQCKTADVVVENFSPQVKARLKIDFETVHKLNPKVIYASLCGVHLDCDQKYYDIVAQGQTGLIALNNGHVNRTAIIDSFAGIKLAFAISSALYSREKTKLGVQISVSMKGCGLDLLEQNLLQTSLTGLNPDTSSDTAICPFGSFETLDRAITLGVGNQAIWQRFVATMTTLGSSFKFNHYTNNQTRLDHKDVLYLAIQAEFKKLSSQQLLEVFRKHSIPAGLVNDMLDVISDQSNFDYNLLQRVQIPAVGQVVIPTGGVTFTGHPNTPFEPAPNLNQNGE
jgi:CoA:oxalate CoA-transferase